MTTVEAHNFIIPFGKYNGRTIGHINRVDPKYIDWLYDRFHGQRKYLKICQAIELACYPNASKD